MTVCNMTIEGGARQDDCPDETTFAYLEDGFRFLRQGISGAVERWKLLTTDDERSSI